MPKTKFTRPTKSHAGKKAQPGSLHRVLACPFCGKPPTVQKVGENHAAEMIECFTAGCVNPHISYYGDGVARSKWNTRQANVAGEPRRAPDL